MVMKYSCLIFALFFQQITLNAQTDSTYFNTYLILIQENLMKVENEKNELIFEKQFNRPYEYLADINADSIDELIVVDSIITDAKLSYTFYLFTGDENFQLIDTIYSGSFFPFVTYSEEIESIIIETGNPEFEIFNESTNGVALPINLWQVENNELFLVNDELYEPFIFENGNLIQLLEYYTENRNDCFVSQSNKGIIASAYTNYINAGEQSLASQLLKKYYLCEDVELFKQQIIDLIYPKAKQ